MLVGSSPKRNVFWHLAPSASFSASDGVVLALKLRVIFSQAGEERWPSAQRMHSLRKSFCKNWWNDKWFSLQSAVMAWLSEGKESLILWEGEGGSLQLSGKPIVYVSPFSILENEDEIVSSGAPAGMDQIGEEDELWEVLTGDEESEIGGDDGPR